MEAQEEDTLKRAAEAAATTIPQCTPNAFVRHRCCFKITQGKRRGEDCNVGARYPVYQLHDRDTECYLGQFYCRKHFLAVSGQMQFPTGRSEAVYPQKGFLPSPEPHFVPRTAQSNLHEQQQQQQPQQLTQASKYPVVQLELVPPESAGAPPLKKRRKAEENVSAQPPPFVVTGE